MVAHAPSRLAALSFVVALALAAGGATCGGDPGEFDSGAASVDVDVGAGATQLVHDADFSLVTLTPPAEGLVELTFSYSDPLFLFAARIDTNRFVAGDPVSLPLSDDLGGEDALRLELEWQDVVYRSADGAAGTVVFDALDVDSDTGAAYVVLRLDSVELSDGAGGTARLDGFVEGEVGSE